MAEEKEPRTFDAGESARLRRALEKGGTIWHKGEEGKAKSITTPEQLKRLLQTPEDMDREIAEIEDRKKAASEKKAPAKK